MKNKDKKYETFYQNVFKSFETLTLLKVTCRFRVAYLKEQNHHFFTVFLNNLLKHVFNIISKLNNHPWKKYKINFLRKKMTPKVVVLQS